MPRRQVRYAVVGLGHIAQVAVLPAFRLGPWPTGVTAMPQVRSRTRRPSVVISQLPSPRSSGSQV